VSVTPVTANKNIKIKTSDMRETFSKTFFKEKMSLKTQLFDDYKSSKSWLPVYVTCTFTSFNVREGRERVLIC